MQKKIIFYSGAALAFLILLWLAIILLFPRAVVDGSSYNKRKIEKAIKIRGMAHKTLRNSCSDEITVYFKGHIDYLFAGITGNNAAVKDNMRELLQGYYGKAREIDSLFLESVDKSGMDFKFPLQSVRVYSMREIFPPYIAVIESEGSLYDENAVNIISAIVENAKNDFTAITDSRLTGLFENVLAGYEAINGDPLAAPAINPYTNDISGYLAKMKDTAGKSGGCFNLLLSECIIPGVKDQNVKISRQTVGPFLPVESDVYSAAHKKLEAHLSFLANDWKRYNEETMTSLINLKTGEMTSLTLPLLSSLADTAGYRYYRDMLDGTYAQHYFNQCGITADFSLSPDSLTEIDGLYYDKNAIDALTGSMETVSAYVTGNIKNLMIKGINYQTNSYLTNIDDYVKWYFSAFTGIDKTVTKIRDFFSGEKAGSGSEQYITENFARIINRNANFSRIIKDDLDAVTDCMTRILNEYLETKELFAETDPQPETLSCIKTGDEYTAPFTDAIIEYIDQVNEALNSLVDFYYQDYYFDNSLIKNAKEAVRIRLTDSILENVTNNIAALKSQQAKNSDELKQQLTDRLMETQNNKIEIINDPLKVITDRLKTGSLLFVNNYFAGLATYKHYGVYIGDNKVIHFAPYEGQEISFENGIIHETTIEGFLEGRVLKIDLNAKPAYDEKEIIRRARSRIGEKGYNLMTNNCEHFARWCVTGQSVSYQTDNISGQIGEAYKDIREEIDTIINFIERLR